MLADGELPPGIDMETLRLAALLKQLPKMELERVRDVVKSAFQPRLVDVTDVEQGLPHTPVAYDEMNKQVEPADNSCQQREADTDQLTTLPSGQVEPAGQADVDDDHVIESSPADVRTRLRQRMGSKLSSTPKSQVAGVKTDSEQPGEDNALGMGKWNFTRVRKSI
jgi:hypothetical protein